MHPRRILTTVGATALGGALVFGGVLTGALDTVAQTDTPVTEEAAGVADARAQAYDDFVASLATQLGVDATLVDASIRTALKEQIDARQAAGDLTAEAAAARKAVIDVTETPLGGGGFRGGFGHGGPGGSFAGPGRGDRDGDRDRGPRPSVGGPVDDGDDEDEPDALPATEDPAAEATPTV